jgi:tetratricopeptide (TPR) repeat protein
MAAQCRIRGMGMAIATILVVPAFSQSTSTGSSGGAGSTGTRTLPLPTSTGPINTNGTTTTPTTSPQIMRVTGRVVMDDGSALTFPATIERICSGNPHAEGYTDAKGYFSLTLGQNADVIQDASETPGSGSRASDANGAIPVSSSPGGLSNTPRSVSSDMRFSTCELRATLAGYRSDRVNLTGRSSMDNPDIGTIVLHKLGSPETATTVTATTLKAPKDARKALEKGLELAKKNKPEDAISSLREAVRIYPQFAFAWFELGKLQAANEHTADAHESFEAAVKAEPRWPEPYLHLAFMAVKAHDWKEVADTTDHVLRLDDWEYPQAYFFNGAANFNLHHIDVAEKDALAAEKLDVEHKWPQIEQLLGMIYLERHRYADAAEKLRSYLLLAPKADDAPVARRQLAEAEQAVAQSSQTAQKGSKQ